MKRLCASLCALALLSLISSLPAQAETRASETRTGPFHYDSSKEVTLSGTVSSVLAKPAPGMIMGSHLLLKTVSGSLDASLGRFGLKGKGAVSVAAGQQVAVTGVMKTIKNKPVFLTRIVKVGSQEFTVRDQHGVPMSPQARERAGRKTGQNGEGL